MVQSGEQSRKVKRPDWLTDAVMFSVVFPGLGQFFQRRWLAGLIYAGAIVSAAARVTLDMWRIVTDSYRGVLLLSRSLAEPASPDAAAAGPLGYVAWRPLCWSFLLFLVIAARRAAAGKAPPPPPPPLPGTPV